MRTLSEVMAATESKTKQRLLPYLVWGTASLFVLFQFFLQLSSGVIVKDLMHDFAITAVGASVLASTYYYIYAVLQTPAGMLLDRFGPRHLLSWGSLCCAFGCFLFGISHQLLVAELARLLMGGGAAFAFVGTVYLAREWFHKEKFSVMVGTTETMGMIGTIIGSLSLAAVLSHYGWRSAMIVSSIIAAGLSIACWFIVHDNPTPYYVKRPNRTSFKKRFQLAFHNPLAWMNGIYNGILFSVLTVFAALWAIPFIATDLHVPLAYATLASCFIFAGTAIGCPTMTYLSEKIQQRRPILIGNAITVMAIMLLIIYLPKIPFVAICSLLFILGLSSSVYILNFAVANDIAHPCARNTYIGLTNAIGVAVAPILAPLIGYLLHHAALAHISGQYETYSLQDYHWALGIMPALIGVAALIAYFMPETYRKKKVYTVKVAKS